MRRLFWSEKLMAARVICLRLLEEMALFSADFTDGEEPPCLLQPGSRTPVASTIMTISAVRSERVKPHLCREQSARIMGRLLWMVFSEQKRRGNDYQSLPSWMPSSGVSASWKLPEVIRDGMQLRALP